MGATDILYLLRFYLLTTLTCLTIEAWPRYRITSVAATNNDILDFVPVHYRSIRYLANLFSRATYSYLDPWMRRGYTGKPGPITADDVPEMVLSEALAGPTAARIQEAWTKAVEEARRAAGVMNKDSHTKGIRGRGGEGGGGQGQGNKNEETTAMEKLDLRFVILFRMEGWWQALIPMMVYRLLGLCCGLVVPVLLKHFLRFLEQSSSSSSSLPSSTPPPPPPPMRVGLLLTGGMFVASALSSALLIASIQMAVEHGQMIRGGLIDLIYRKSLVLAPEARQAHTVGSIVNRMSVDCDKWAINKGAIYAVYSTIGWSIAAGILVVLILMPIQGRLGAKLNKSEAVKLNRMDERVRLMAEILASIKVIKLYGWEASFQNKINGVRQEELQALRKMTWTRALMDIVLTSTTLLMALSTFAVYAMVGGPGFTPGKMTVDVVFASIALFGMVSEPMDMISHCMASMISLKVSSRRIQEFLLSDEMDETVVDRYPRERGQPNAVAIRLEHATMTWSRPPKVVAAAGTPGVSGGDDQGQDAHRTEEAVDESSPLLANGRQKQYHHHPSSTTTTAKPVLSNIDLTCHGRTLTAVVGRVGQGKSSLLSAIIGEMYKLEGSISVYGSVAYVPQQAWILHGTIRHNIVLNKQYDPVKYNRVLDACCLKPDIEILPAGDMTEIGERGINLSGGQKQRIALARATYQDADIYLLDDPLSAVDAHVGHHMWTHLLGPKGILRNKTRVLVTHGIHHLHMTDQIVTLHEGRISEKGRFQQLVARRGDFFRLINEGRAEALARRRSSGSLIVLGGTVDAGGGGGGAHADDSNLLGHTGEMHSPLPVERTEVAKDDNGDNKAGELTAEETVSEDLAGWWIYRRYAKAATYRNVVLVIMLFMAAQALHIATNIWLKYWIDNESEHNRDSPHRSASYYLGMYGLLVAFYMVANGIANYVTPVVGGLRAAAIVHDGLLSRVLRLPMSFFDTTPQGRVLNRFSSDLEPIDSKLAMSFVTVFTFTFTIVGTILVIAFSTPIFLFVVPPAVLAYLLVQRYYIQTSSTLKKIYHTTQSPLYSHFAETLAGVSSLRVQEELRDEFVEQNERKADNMFQKNLAFSLSNRWLAIRLEWLGSTMVLVAGLSATAKAQEVDPGMVGLALSYAVNITATINYLVRYVSEIQNSMANLERIYEYSEKPTEAPATSAEMGAAEEDRHLLDKWPQQGRIQFVNYSTRYRQGLDLVLRDVSFEAQPGEKIGIVGRTGAGKSSLTLALFRIVEAANSYWAKASEQPREAQGRDHQLSPDEEVEGGAIVIDGVDISTIGLNDLRRHLSIIPQEPILFAGTLRENLDPFGERLDVDLWEALERAHLKSHVSTLPGGLWSVVAQGGENFSMGQRSLICLARALLRKTKILVLDEATSSVDVQTDELIQQTIRTEFKDRTILTIAHRIKTVMDYDKILVLENGRVVEFDTPAALLQRGADSLFFSLAKQAGEAKRV
ncbi:Canalicular multispecific organic anion transporter 2 [Actinomortierella ambigua]|nr:Canalicular multispecific organic anion transporter 2 [Actinomortierella ambigua]